MKKFFLFAVAFTVLAMGQAIAQSGSYGVPAMAAYPATTAATDGTGGADEPILTIKKRVDEVNVLFIATDRHGKFVRNLNQSDFSFFDDHKPVESIVAFRHETDLPLKLGLLIDVSGSVRTRFDFEQDAANGFLQHTIRSGFDSAFVMGFNGRQQLAQDFTDNVAKLSSSVGALRDGGGTALYDAIYHACKDKLLKEQSDRPV